MDTDRINAWHLMIFVVCLVVAILFMRTIEGRGGRFQLAAHTGGFVYRLDTVTGDMRLFTPMRDGQTAPTKIQLVELGGMVPSSGK